MILQLPMSQLILEKKVIVGLIPEIVMTSSLLERQTMPSSGRYCLRNTHWIGITYLSLTFVLF